jgi:SAM-dependent methyltransferase
MLAVARPAAEREGARVDWCQGRAEALPFRDGSFDLVLCQQGLQFVPERPRAVAEMYRVLTGGGRAALSVWRGLDHHPFFARFDEVLVRHLGIPALSSPFALGDEGELHALLAGAGFRDVAIEPHSLTARFPDPQGFVAMEVDVLAAAVPSVQHLGAQARKALTEAIGDEMAASVRELTQGHHLVIPMHAYVARASRPPA